MYVLSFFQINRNCKQMIINLLAAPAERTNIEENTLETLRTWAQQLTIVST